MRLWIRSMFMQKTISALWILWKTIGMKSGLRFWQGENWNAIEGYEKEWSINGEHVVLGVPKVGGKRNDEKQFKKEAFTESVKENVKYLYRKTIEEASQQQIFQAVSYAVKDVIIDKWLETQKEYEKEDPKIVYYMSMEFFMGRALGNNLMNLTVYDDVKEALEEMGIDLNGIEDEEPDPALATAVLAVWQPVLWNFLPLWDTVPMAAVSVTATVCLSRRSRTVFRLRCRTTG